MNNMTKLRTILYFAFVVLVFVLIPSNKPLQALKCDKYLEGMIDEFISLSYPNLNVSGFIDDGYCLQNCVIPPNIDGDMAVADPIESFQYQFDSTTGTWMDFPAGTWVLIAGASPTDCTEDAGFWLYYESYIYQFNANIDISGLSDGTHTIFLRAKYEIGRYFISGGQSFTIDNTPPTCNISYPNEWRNANDVPLLHVTLTENDPGGSGIQSGNVDVRTRAYGAAVWGGWGNTGLPSSGNTINNFNYAGSTCNEYQFRYRVTDNAGNLSEGCNGAGGTWCDPGYTARVDTVAPTRSISITDVSGDSTICKTSFQVVLGENDTCSDVANGRVERKINSGSWQFYANRTTNFDYDGSNGNSYQFRYKVTDNAGNESTWAYSPTVTIDNSISPGVPTLTSPLASWRNTNPRFKATITDNNPPSGDTIRGHFHIETTGGTVVLDDGVSNWRSSGSTVCYPAGCASNYSMSDGQYNWRAYGEDDDNCTGASTANRWLGIDKTDPTGSITHLPASPDAGDQVTFSASGLDLTSGMASIRIYVDSGLVKTCNNATICIYVGGPYSVGGHSYYAVFTDNAANSLTTSTTNFTVTALDLSCTLGAAPSFGAPGFTTTLTANLSGSAEGPALYQFDCTNDGTFDSPPITIDADSQNYSGCPGYNSDATARVQVTREGLTADCTTNLYICSLEVTPDPAGVMALSNIQLTATYDPDGAGSQPSQNVTTNANTTWFSPDDNDIVDVDYNGNKGLIRGLRDDTTTVRATYPACGSDTINFTVAPRVSSYRVIISGLNRAPTATDLSVTPPGDWCVTQPRYWFRWKYNDIDGDRESQYRFQIRQGAVIIVDRTVPKDIASGDWNDTSEPVIANILLPGIHYGTTYSWRVFVWDSNGTRSVAWANGPGFITEDAPYPDCNFTWSPSTPNPGEGAQFTDNSTCYDDNPNGGDCVPGAPYDTGNDIFRWDFPEGIPNNYPAPAPEQVTTTFSDRGDKQAILTVTDSNGNSCTITKTITVNLPLPTWKEIRPF